MSRRSLGFVLMMTMILSLSFSLSCVTAYADDVIEINNVDDLYNVRNNMSGNYKLMNDIDLTDDVAAGGQYNYQGRGWEPLGATTQTEFSGTFEGNGHKIKGLKMSGVIVNEDSETNSAGLFWKNGGVIRNLTVEGSVGDENNGNWKYLGFIAGINNGTIANCRTNGTVAVYANYNSSAVGSIAGLNKGTVADCITAGIVKNKNTSKYAFVGGICGNNYGTDAIIQRCANTADVTDNSRFDMDRGAACGIALGGTIDNCYNSGTIKATYDYPGYGNGYYSRPFGISQGGTVSNTYNAGSVSGGRNGRSFGGSTTNTNCYCLDTGFPDSYAQYLNDAQMQKEASFAGFDFDNVWIIDPGADYKYPQLRNCRQDLGREIDMIELKSAPDKITYKTDDEFDPTGCVVTVFYKDNGSEDIDVTTDMLSGYDMSTPGIQTVTFSYRGYTLTFKINVNQRPEITGMELTSHPLKTTFIRGTEFDFTGAVAQIRYKDNTTEDFLINAKDCTGGDINTSGDYVITYTKFGHSVTFNVSVVPVREEGIHIESLPDKVSYIEGEEIDPAGLEVYVDYNSGASAPIEDYTIADYDNSAGVQTITVQYKTFEATFEVSFAKKSVLSIEVTKQPNKTEYVFGQIFNPEGMIVTANLDNGKTEEVTDYVVSPMEDRNGMQDLTISYAGKITYVTVFVTQRALDSISITTKPYKLTYIEGSEFDPEGMVVTAKYNDDSTEAITDYTMTKLGRTPGNKTIVVSYNGKTTTLAVTVIAKTVVNLTVTAPNKVNYVKGETFDPTGMVVTALYNDGTTSQITDYRVAGFGESDEVNILEISYGGKAQSIVVTIHDPGAWELTSTPTCTKAGQEARKCKECGDIIQTRAKAALGHNYGEWRTVTQNSCEAEGLKQRTCSVCHETESQKIAPKGHAWDAPKYEWTGYTSVTATRICKNDAAHKQTETVKTTSKITRVATYTAKGKTTYTAEFSNPAFAKQTKTVEDIPMLQKDSDPATSTDPIASEEQKGEDGTALGTGASAEAAEKAITGMKSDADPAGSKFTDLQVRSPKQTKKAVTIKWKKPAGTSKFVVYGNQCGKKNKLKKIKTTTKKTLTLKKIAGKKVKKGTYYKFMVVAIDKNNKVVSTSKVIHVATKGGKVGNPLKVTIKAPKKAKVTLKKGKTTKIKATQTKPKNLTVKNHVGLRYESSNEKVATVTKAGKVKAVSKGKSKIYVFAQNGISKTVTVSVK